ncbi:MAG: hypothetical protein KGQ49_07145, partial [Verrucomicrobia bacterium]|nr:hypothetical protein [Verrucomicrobiota bacterium]
FGPATTVSAPAAPSGVIVMAILHATTGNMKASVAWHITNNALTLVGDPVDTLIVFLLNSLYTIL